MKRLGFVAFFGLLAATAQAQDVESFYRGRTLDLVIGFTPGGGYDLYARLVAQFMGDHLPGKPKIVARNMPGAGSRTAVGYVANIAPKDGTVLATASQSLLIEQALGSKQQFDMTKVLYVGNPVQENNATVVWAASQVASIEDARRRDVTIGSTGDDPSSQYPKVMNALLGTRFRIVTGYPGGNDINLAMERGEVDGRGSSTVTEWKSTHADWLQQKKINIIVQFGLKKAAHLPDVPLLMDLARNERDRMVLRLLSSAIAFGRQIFTTPGVPPERLEALRRAFDATMTDPGFVAAVQRQNFDLSPLTGEEMQRLAHEITEAPEEQRATLRAILAQAN